MPASHSAPLKERIHALIDGLPDDCTADDVLYELYLFEKIRRGEKSLRMRKGGIGQEEVRKRAAAWGKK